MKTFDISITCVFLCLVLIGCDYIGGGVAGASSDPPWQVKAAKRYVESVATNEISVVLSPLKEEQPPQLFEEIMDKFPIHEGHIDAEWTPVIGTCFNARYREHRFDLREDNTVIISETLPKIFNMHPIRLGIGTVASTPVIMIVNKSRSSTGLYFVGLYTAKGTPLYRAVLGAGQVWDIRPSDTGINILGHSEIRSISIKQQAEQAGPGYPPQGVGSPDP